MSSSTTLNWVLRPPVVEGWFLDQCTEAIELVAAGRAWELEEFVEAERDVVGAERDGHDHA